MEKLNPFKNNLDFPAIGLGTYHLQGETLKDIIREAYSIGYRNFDGASYYHNEKELGEVLREFPRKEFKITSKVWHDSMGYYPVLNSFEKSLNLLQLNSIDLFLIHWPHPHDLIMESLEALRDLKQKGLVMQYGVSNFTVHHLQEALKEGYEIACNQVEYHPYLNQEELLSFCEASKIQIIAYCPIARGKVNQHKEILKIADKYQKSPVQVTLRWHIQKNIIPIPKTKNKERLLENFDVFDFNLTDLEIVKINNLNTNGRLIDQAWSHFDF